VSSYYRVYGTESTCNLQPISLGEIKGNVKKGRKKKGGEEKNEVK
jgi:hypothetical protein